MMDKTIKPYFYLLSSVIVVATLYCYNPFNLYFLADDFLHIPASATNVWVQQNSLRPIGNLSLKLGYFFSNNHALGYHITNLLLHIINAVLVYSVSRHIFQQFANIQNAYLSILIAIFFFSYPFHSEAVFWIIGRSGSLGALFFLAAFYCWLQQQQSVLFKIGVFVFFQLALFSYESSWVFPIVIALFMYIQWSTNKEYIRTLLGLFLLIIFQLMLHLYIRYEATGEFMNQYDANSFVQFNIPLLLQNFFRLFARTLVPPLFSNTLFLSIFFLAIFIIIWMVVVMFRTKKMNRFYVVLTLVWLFSYLPYLSIGIDTHGVEGERYLYLPSLFFCIWLVYLLHQLLSSKATIIAVLVVCTVNFFFLQNARNYYTKAGTITQLTIEQINQLPNKQRIFFYQLPQYNKGAVVFRTGLEDAVKWLGKKSEQQLIVVTKDNSDEVPKQHHYNFFRVQFNEKITIPSISSILIPDTSFRKNYIEKDTLQLFFNPSTDAWFQYSDTSLTIQH